jgi:hypothetical protein
MWRSHGVHAALTDGLLFFELMAEKWGALDFVYPILFYGDG